MKRLITVTAVILFGCLFAGFFSDAPKARNDVEQTAVYNEKQIDNTSASKNQVYIIKSYEGAVTVFIKGEAVPYKQTDTSVNTLPKGDVLRLERGIEVVGDENLKKYLEDYCS